MSDHERVAIFWDYENCRAASNLSGHALVNSIRRIAYDYGSVTLFKAYLELSEISMKSSILRSELQCSGVSLIDCPHNGRKDVADKMILVDMLAYAIDNPAPATIILISGDRDFAYALSTLRLRRYRVVLIVPTGTVHISLKSQASVLFDWNADILGKVERNSPPLGIIRPSYSEGEDDMCLISLCRRPVSSDDPPRTYFPTSSIVSKTPQDFHESERDARVQAWYAALRKEASCLSDGEDTTAVDGSADNPMTSDVTSIVPDGSIPAGRSRPGCLVHRGTNESESTASASVIISGRSRDSGGLEVKDQFSTSGPELAAILTPLKREGLSIFSLPDLQTTKANATGGSPLLCGSSDDRDSDVRTRATATNTLPTSVLTKEGDVVLCRSSTKFTDPFQNLPSFVPGMQQPSVPVTPSPSSADLDAVGRALRIAPTPSSSTRHGGFIPANDLGSVAPLVNTHDTTPPITHERLSTTEPSTPCIPASWIDDSSDVASDAGFFSSSDGVPSDTGRPSTISDCGNVTELSSTPPLSRFVVPPANAAVIPSIPPSIDVMPSSHPDPKSTNTAPSAVCNAPQLTKRDTVANTPSSPILPPLFRTLICLLEERRRKGVQRPFRSTIATELVKREKQVYRAAGTDKFKTYIEQAVQDGVVLLGGRERDMWISLHPNWHGKAPVPQYK